MMRSHWRCLIKKVTYVICSFKRSLASVMQERRARTELWSSIRKQGILLSWSRLWLIDVEGSVFLEIKSIGCGKDVRTKRKTEIRNNFQLSLNNWMDPVWIAEAIRTRACLGGGWRELSCASAQSFEMPVHAEARVLHRGQGWACRFVNRQHIVIKVMGKVWSLSKNLKVK